MNNGNLGHTSTNTGTSTGANLVWTTEEIYPNYNYIIGYEGIIDNIIREEKKKITSDINKINTLLKGTKEDIEIAVELLKKDTRYLWRIVYEIKINNNFNNLEYIISDYINANLRNINLTDEIC